MAYTADQIEKNTIVLRFAVSVYKMNESELRTVLEALVSDASNPAEPQDDTLNHLPAEKIEIMRRQMMIARIFVLTQQLDKNTLLDRLGILSSTGLKWVREYPRLDCFLPVDFAVEGKAYRSCIRDISANGMFIETSDGFEQNQEVALCFALGKAREFIPFKVKGRVTRIHAEGIGVQYKNITHYQRDIIDTLIHRIF